MVPITAEDKEVLVVVQDSWMAISGGWAVSWTSTFTLESCGRCQSEDVCTVTVASLSLFKWCVLVEWWISMFDEKTIFHWDGCGRFKIDFFFHFLLLLWKFSFFLCCCIKVILSGRFCFFQWWVLTTCQGQSTLSTIWRSGSGESCTSGCLIWWRWLDNHWRFGCLFSKESDPTVVLDVVHEQIIKFSCNLLYTTEHQNVVLVNDCWLTASCTRCIHVILDCNLCPLPRFQIELPEVRIFQVLLAFPSKHVHVSAVDSTTMTCSRFWLRPILRLKMSPLLLLDIITMDKVRPFASNETAESDYWVILIRNCCVLIEWVRNLRCFILVASCLMSSPFERF